MYLVVVSMLACVLASCDLFSTRDPQPPDLGSTFIWTPASTTATLLDNFTGTLQAIDPSNFARCFVSSQDTVTDASFGTAYIFTPKAGLDASSLSVFAAWGQQSEQTFLTKLRASLQSNSKITVTLSNTVINQSTASTAHVSADYMLVLPLPSNSSLPASISGSLIFQMVLVTTESGTKEWRIIGWSDFAGTNTSVKTFTDLKLQTGS